MGVCTCLGIRERYMHMHMCGYWGEVQYMHMHMCVSMATHIHVLVALVYVLNIPHVLLRKGHPTTVTLMNFSETRNREREGEG